MIPHKRVHDCEDALGRAGAVRNTYRLDGPR